MLPKPGQTIELIHMPNDPYPIPDGTKGVVEEVNRLGNSEYQLIVKWENGRGLMLIYPVDQFRIVE